MRKIPKKYEYVIESHLKNMVEDLANITKEDDLFAFVESRQMRMNELKKNMVQLINDMESYLGNNGLTK